MRSMPVEKYIRGTGLTKETRVKIRPSNQPRSEEIDAIKGVIERSAKASTLEGQVAAIEKWAIDTLEAAGIPASGQAMVDDVQSMPWYANKILCELYTIRKVKERVAAGDGSETDYLAAACVRLGALIYEIAFKFDWEDETLFGIKSRQDRKEGPKARKLANDRRNEFLRQQADVLRKKGKTSKSEIARHILSRAEKAIGAGAEGFWADISRMDADTIRKII